MQRYFLLLVWCFSQLLNSAELPESLTLSTHSRSMEEIVLDKQSEMALAQVKCIFDKLNITSDILMLPWARTKRELNTGNVDAAFLTSLGEIPGSIESDAIYLEKWFLYTSSEDHHNLKSNARLGTIRGSDTEKWLLARNHHPYIQANSYGQLLKQFAAGRFDYLVADQPLVEPLLKQHGLRDNVEQFFVRYVPKVMSFSQDIVLRYPSLPTHFNKQIASCQPASQQLSEHEKLIVWQYVENNVIPFFNNDIIKPLTLLEQHASTLSDEDIKKLDSQWRDDVQTGKFDVVRQVMENSVSRQLQYLKTREANIIGELFITSNRGVLLASSDITSDYWQGDEAKIQQVTPELEYWISPISFDRSAKIFETQVSFRLTKKNTSAIVVVGVKIDHLITGASYNMPFQQFGR